MNKILASPIKKVHQKIANNEIRPSEICDSVLNLVSHAKSLNPYITVTRDLARKQSELADSRQTEKKILSDLDGIPIAVKDNFCIKGELTTCGSKMLSNFKPGYDATVYEKLKNAGAVLIGKTNLDQFAMGSGTVDSYFGPTKNLWGSDFMGNYYCESKTGSFEIEENSTDKWRIAGGSSGGSAVAVSTGTVFAALGSDTGGSTRNPASYCGLVGFKPTYGLVSRHGLIPLVNSMDVPGILTRTIEDSITVLNVIAGPDEMDSTTVDENFESIESLELPDFGNVRIGIPEEYKIPDLSDEVNENWSKVIQLLQEAGSTVVPISLPHSEYSILCYSILNACEVSSNMARYDGIEFGIRAPENSSTEKLFALTRKLGFNDVVRSRILAGNYFLLQENYDEFFLKAMKVRRLISQDFEKVWASGVDVILTPTTISDAPLFDDFVKLDNQSQCLVQDFFTQPANMAGIPAVNFPVGISRNGMPISLQLMGANFGDGKVLRLAKWIEDRVGFPRIVLKDDSLLK